jgi:8-oxo-dGTP pyrophosphatase MutT (NUDIX family)
MSVDARAFVRVVVKNNLGDILVIRHRLNSLWNLPGGKVELGESLETAAVRELWEETGIVAIRLVPLFATSIISEGGIWTGHFFAALAAIPGVELRECTKAVEI